VERLTLAPAASRTWRQARKIVAAIEPGAGRTVAEEAGSALERALYREVTLGVEKGLSRGRFA